MAVKIVVPGFGESITEGTIARPPGGAARGGGRGGGPGRAGRHGEAWGGFEKNRGGETGAAQAPGKPRPGGNARPCPGRAGKTPADERDSPTHRRAAVNF